MDVLEALKRCCLDEDARYAIGRPWTDGQWTYATDGALLVAIQGTVNGARTQDDIAAERLRVPNAYPVLVQAGLEAMRGGSGKMKPWPTIEFEKPIDTNDRWEYYESCPHCGSNQCCTAGWKDSAHADELVRICGQRFALPKVWLVGQLGSVDYLAIKRRAADHAPLGFRFLIEGEIGYGALMPVREGDAK